MATNFVFGRFALGHRMGSSPTSVRRAGSYSSRMVADQALIKAYYARFGEPYLSPAIFEHYPEARVLPAYIRSHFAQAKNVLDLGFGTGLWFWASFLPSLECLDGIDLYPAALEEADRLFQFCEAPAGFQVAHAAAGSAFDASSMRCLQRARGRFVFQDYRCPWPAELAAAPYDLITEHGGGLGQSSSDADVVEVVETIARHLKRGGKALFANFKTRPAEVEQALGRVPGPSFELCQSLLQEAVRQAGMRMVEMHTVDQVDGPADIQSYFYGYAEKMH